MLGMGKRKSIEITDVKTMLTLPQFLDLMSREPEFHALAAVVGLEAAEESLKDMHWLYTGKFKRSGAIVTDRDWGAEAGRFSRLLVAQREKAIATRNHIALLFQKAMSNQLGRDLRKPHNIMPMAEYGATEADIESVKGAKWIVEASSSNTMSVDQITDLIIECRRTDRSVFELDTLKFLHDRLVPKDSIYPRRPLNSEQPWPSSGAAKALQKLVADKVSAIGARTRFLSDADWDSFACYFLGAYMRTHGFPDGNGRPNRALYVLTMLEGFRPFVAPHYNFTTNSLVKFT